MCNIESFKIDLKALPQGVTNLEFKLDDEYFQAIDAPDIQRGELQSSLSINRTDDFFELNFHTEGPLRPMTDSWSSSEMTTQKKMTS